MKESSDWVENIHLGQFEYGKFKNGDLKKKYWRLPHQLFIKLSNTRKNSHIQLGQDILTSFYPIHKLFSFSERGDNSVGMYFSFFENFDLGRRGSLSKIPLFWRLKPYFSMKESSDWVKNIHLGQFEYGEFKNEKIKKKYWHLPHQLFIKLSNTRKTCQIMLKISAWVNSSMKNSKMELARKNIDVFLINHS